MSELRTIWDQCSHFSSQIRGCWLEEAIAIHFVLKGACKILSVRIEGICLLESSL